MPRAPAPIGWYLGEARLLPVPVWRRAGDPRHFPRDLDPDATPFPSARGHGLRRTERAYLNIGRNADPEEPARLPRRVSLLEELRPLGELLRLLEPGLLFPPSVHEPRPALPRHLPRP